MNAPVEQLGRRLKGTVYKSYRGVHGLKSRVSFKGHWGRVQTTWTRFLALLTPPPSM